MYHINERLKKVPLSQVRPTQITVGYKEVATKRGEWGKLSKKSRLRVMSETIFPAVLGPERTFFILDHHHTALALSREDASDVQLGLVKDLSSLSLKAFWIFLDHYSWVHPYNSHGQRMSLNEVPTKLEDLTDDPYRSLAADIRNQGGFAKTDTPYMEFLWANYFRDSISENVLRDRPKAALRMGMTLAISKKCSFLPGWSGVK